MTRLTPFKMTSLWSPLAFIVLLVSLVCVSVFARPAQESAGVIDISVQGEAIPQGQGVTLTQSDAHLLCQNIFDLAQSTWLEKIAENEKLEALIRLAIERERQRPDCFVFYHGQSGSMRILQDFLAEIYPHVMKKTTHDFVFLRFWGTADKHANLQELLMNYGTTWETDHEPNILKRLLSVNLSIFGNISAYHSGECSFRFFLDSESVNYDAGRLKWLFREIFEYYTFDEFYLDELAELTQSIDVNAGNLIQIFIPREKVDTYVYLSGPFGHPIADPFTRYWLRADEVSRSHNEHVPLSTILNLYRKDPSSFQDLNELQARILMSQDGMLNPESGISMYRYTLEAPETTHVYKQKLKDIVNRMLNNGSIRKDMRALA